MKKWILHIIFICTLSAALLSACSLGDSSDEPENSSKTEAEENAEKEEPEEPEVLNEYGITDRELQSFITIYKKYQKNFMENYMDRASEDDPRELFMKSPPTDLKWVTSVAELAEQGTYSLEDIKAHAETIEHYKDGYVFEHTVIEWLEKENISEEKWKQLMDNHIMGDMDFIENVMRPAYTEVYEDLLEKAEE